MSTASIKHARAGKRLLRSGFTLPTIKELLGLYRVTAKSELSQNFILNESITDRLAAALGDDLQDQLIIEIGPGEYSLGWTIERVLSMKPRAGFIDEVYSEAT